MMEDQGIKHTPELPNSCFICKSSERINRKGKETASKKSILGCSYLEAIWTIWELPDNPGQYEDKNDPGTIQFCRKCSKIVKEILKIDQDIKNLQKQLLQLKTRVEDTIKNKFNINLSDNVIMAGSSKRNFNTIHGAEDLLRRQIILKSRGFEGAFEGGTEIQDEQNELTISGQHPQKRSCFKNQSGQSIARKKVMDVAETVELDAKLDISRVLETSNVCKNHQDIQPGCEELKTVEISEQNEYQGNELVDMLEDGQHTLRVMEDNMKTDTCNEVEETGLKCSQCRYTFKDEIGRVAHIRKLHQGTTHPYFCDTCDKKFKTRRQLIVHQMTHTGEIPFMCEHCGKGFREGKVLRLHLKLMHVGGLKYVCKICNRGFLTPSKLKTHEISHSKKYPVSCSDCGKGFVSKTALDLHMVMHMAVNPFECLDCNKTYSSARALDVHRSIHTLQFKYLCTFCPYGTSTSKADLERHILKHQYEKLVECNICNKKFKYKKTLQKHLKIHEGRERKYQCSLCGKSFFENHQLVKHIRTHEDNRPFVCEICNRRFNLKQYLTEHLKTHERNSNTQPKHCMQESGKPEATTIPEPKSMYSVIFQQEYTDHTDLNVPSSLSHQHHSELEPSSRNNILCDLETDTDLLSVNLFEPSYLNL